MNIDELEDLLKPERILPVIERKYPRYWSDVFVAYVESVQETYLFSPNIAINKFKQNILYKTMKLASIWNFKYSFYEGPFASIELYPELIFSIGLTQHSEDSWLQCNFYYNRTNGFYWRLLDEPNR